jgi:hypothetical protein
MACRPGRRPQERVSLALVLGYAHSLGQTTFPRPAAPASAGFLSLGAGRAAPAIGAKERKDQLLLPQSAAQVQGLNFVALDWRLTLQQTLALLSQD